MEGGAEARGLVGMLLGRWEIYFGPAYHPGAGLIRVRRPSRELLNRDAADVRHFAVGGEHDTDGSFAG
jgi:hypothetical protein